MKIYLNIILAVVAALFFCIHPESILADAAENGEYTIQEGDTLWDISSEKLRDPFLWKKIWEQNPHIKNPDLIFPGQKLTITGQRKKESEKKASRDAELEALKKVAEKIPGQHITSKKKTYIVSRQVLLNSGYIAEAVPVSAGKVSGSPQSKSVMGRGDFAYINLDKPVPVNTKFYVLSKPEEIVHPITDKFIGHLITIKGILETIGEESGNIKTLIHESYEEILKDDIISSYYTFDLTLEPENERRPNIGGVVIKMHKNKSMLGMHGVAYIDKGAADGVQIGDSFTVITGSKPNIPVGVIQIISVWNKTSAALVKKSSSEFKVGDSFGN